MSIQDCQQVIACDSRRRRILSSTRFASALGQIQKKMMQESEVILRIEYGIEVEVIKAIEKTYKERFLFSSFKKRTSYHVELEVTVSVITLQVGEVEFTKEMTDDPDVFKFLLFQKYKENRKEVKKWSLQLS